MCTRKTLFAQLTYRESLRDIEACPSAESAGLYHMGIRHSSQIKCRPAKDLNFAAAFSVTLFEKIHLNKDFFDTQHILEYDMISSQLNLFNN